MLKSVLISIVGAFLFLGCCPAKYTVTTDQLLDMKAKKAAVDEYKAAAVQLLSFADKAAGVNTESIQRGCDVVLAQLSDLGISGDAVDALQKDCVIFDAAVANCKSAENALKIALIKGESANLILMVNKYIGFKEEAEKEAKDLVTQLNQAVAFMRGVMGGMQQESPQE